LGLFDWLDTFWADLPPRCPRRRSLAETSQQLSSARDAPL